MITYVRVKDLGVKVNIKMYSVLYFHCIGFKKGEPLEDNGVKK